MTLPALQNSRQLLLLCFFWCLWGELYQVPVPFTMLPSQSPPLRLGQMTEVGGCTSPLSCIVATFGFYICLLVPFYLVTHPCKDLWTRAPQPRPQLDLFSGCYCHMMSMGAFTFLSPPKFSRPVLCMHCELGVVLESFQSRAP